MIAFETGISYYTDHLLRSKALIEAFLNVLGIITAIRRMAQTEADRNTVSLIEDFGKTYIEEEREHWGVFLWMIHQKCEDLVRGKVQASVTSRVKQWISLEKKLRKMYLEPKDRKVKDINAENIHDIAALRIRAFFPKQLSMLYKIIEQNFDVQKTKPFKPDWKDPDKLEAYDERFGNYEGQHYWVKINENDWQNLVPESLLPELREKFKNQTVEIQVRSSMLLDGWAEVRHDVQYKALGGAPSRGERELLDTMKGVVKSMEVLLDHLLDVHEDRVKSDNTKLETAPLLEQAIVRALPQLSLSHESVDNMHILYPFLEAISIDTPGRLKEVIRKSKFSEKFDGFCESRKISKQPVSTFILEEVFMTLSETEIKELLEKVTENHELHQVFCRSLSWLEEHLFILEHMQQKPLEPDEIERCIIMWHLHEYISTTWPEYKPKISSLLENLLSIVKSSPVPRVDISIYIAIAEILCRKHYRVPEAQITQKIGNPKFKELILRSERSKRQMRQIYDMSEQQVQAMREAQHHTSLLLFQDQLHEQLVFRWHQHDSIYDNASISGNLWGCNSGTISAGLLGITTYQLHGALLHRAVCHGDKDKNVTLVRQLLQNTTDANVDFVNKAGQSTLHVATIFSPATRTVKSILETNQVNVNKADIYGETPLLAASFLGKKHLMMTLLNEASINVNLQGEVSPEVAAVGLWNNRRK